MSSNLEIFPSFEAAEHQTENQVEASPKEEKMIDYIRELQMIEEEMEPLKEQKRDLKAAYKEAGWLTGDEISMTVKAYRMLKTKDFDFDEFSKVYQSLAKIAGRQT